MVRPVALLLVVFAAACGGGSSAPAGGAPGPAATTAAGVVEQFMAAVADSNLTRMSQLWGTTRGSAAVVGQPENWERRVFVMQAWLTGGTTRIIGNVSSGGEDRRQVTVELARGGCTKQVPFLVVRLGTGSWLITGVDIDAAGNPARPCGEF